MTENNLIEPSNEQLVLLKRWRTSTFWVMLIGYIGYYLIRGNLPVALPLLSREFGYTNSQLGYLLTFSELFYALGKFTTGPLADQIGGKKIFMIECWVRSFSISLFRLMSVFFILRRFGVRLDIFCRWMGRPRQNYRRMVRA